MLDFREGTLVFKPMIFTSKKTKEDTPLSRWADFTDQFKTASVAGAVGWPWGEIRDGKSRHEAWLFGLLRIHPWTSTDSSIWTSTDSSIFFFRSVFF